MRFLFCSLFFLTSVYAQEIYQIKEKGIKGKEFSLNSLKGKVTLIVNIASQCGYTPQLEKLETLYKKYQKQGLVILGVPTNDFGGQTPEDDKGMLEFCQKNYDVTFPLLSKRTVKGNQKRELYKYLTEKTPKAYQGEIGWNFEKFLVNRKGEVVGRMKSSVDPLDKDLTKKIESLL